MSDRVRDVVSRNRTEMLRSLDIPGKECGNSGTLVPTDGIDMRQYFSVGQKARVWIAGSGKKLITGKNIVNRDCTVVSVTKRLVTVHYDIGDWCETFGFPDYLEKRVFPL